MPKFPFSPAVLDALPEELCELFRGLELTLLEEICSRLNLAGELNEVTVQAIQALRSHGIDLKEIQKAIAETTNTSMKKLEELFEDVVRRNQRYYGEMIDLAGVTAPPHIIGIEDTWAIYEQTKGQLTNITASMGFLVNNGRTMLKPAKAYQWALDSAVAQVQSGAVSYNQAVKRAVKQLADSGLKTVSYESGHVDQVDVATRRAVMSGVNSVNAKYREQSMDYLGTDLVEVTAHPGARNTGSGPMNHASWQGAVYHWSEKGSRNKGRYPDLVETTGYGSGEGLLGWNCRHNFFPYIKGASEPAYTKEELDHIDDRFGCTFEGREYDAYSATQYQRRIERTIRKLTREKTAYKAAGLSEDAKNVTIRMNQLHKKYTEFSKVANLPEQRERMRVLYE